MKKAGVLLVTAFLLVGCSAQPTFETIGDENIQTVSATMQQVLLEGEGVELNADGFVDMKRYCVSLDELL